MRHLYKIEGLTATGWVDHVIVTLARPLFLISFLCRLIGSGQLDGGRDHSLPKVVAYLWLCPLWYGALAAQWIGDGI